MGDEVIEMILRRAIEADDTKIVGFLIACGASLSSNHATFAIRNGKWAVVKRFKLHKFLAPEELLIELNKDSTELFRILVEDMDKEKLNIVKELVLNIQ